MSHKFDAEYWASRAEEARIKSESQQVAEARDALRYIASVYEGMAQRARGRSGRPADDLARRLPKGGRD